SFQLSSEISLAERRELIAEHCELKAEVFMPHAHFTTSEGKFTILLFDQEASKTVENFVGLAEGTREWTDPRTGRKGTGPYYNGTVFHRVIAGFMIQGGDPLGQGTGGPGYKSADEFSPKRRHGKAGVLSMANSGPNTNGGQFFIQLPAPPGPDAKPRGC